MTELDWSFCAGPFWPDALGLRAAATSELVRHRAAALGADQVLRRRAPELAEVLVELSQADGLPPAWTPMLAPCHDAVDVVVAATGLVLELVEHARPFSLELAFDRPTTIIADPLVLPRVQALRLRWDGSTTFVGTPDPVAAVDVGTRRASWLHSAAASRLPRIWDSGGFAVLRHAGAGLFEELGAPATPTEEHVARIGEAAEILRVGAAEYLAWVRPMIRWIVPLAAPPGEYASGGGAHAPGVIGASMECSPLVIAESLVHEAAHQYVFLATRFGSLTTPDGRLYYSPLAKRMRPLDRIVIAFHAAANIAAFYELLRAREVEWAPEASTVDRNATDCRELARHLEDDRALTALGRAFVEPLLAHLRTLEPA